MSDATLDNGGAPSDLCSVQGMGVRTSVRMVLIAENAMIH